MEEGLRGSTLLAWAALASFAASAVPCVAARPPHPHPLSPHSAVAFPQPPSLRLPAESDGQRQTTAAAAAAPPARLGEHWGGEVGGDEGRDEGPEGEEEGKRRRSRRRPTGPSSSHHIGVVTERDEEWCCSVMCGCC